MQLRFYLDPGSDLPHIRRHGVTEAEVEEVLAAALEDGEGAESARVAIGRTEAGRFLKVVYVPDPDRAVFVITALDLGPMALKALRRRLRRGR